MQKVLSPSQAIQTTTWLEFETTATSLRASSSLFFMPLSWTHTTPSSPKQRIPSSSLKIQISLVSNSPCSGHPLTTIFGVTSLLLSAHCWNQLDLSSQYLEYATFHGRVRLVAALRPIVTPFHEKNHISLECLKKTGRIVSVFNKQSVGLGFNEYASARRSYLHIVYEWAQCNRFFLFVTPSPPLSLTSPLFSFIRWFFKPMYFVYSMSKTLFCLGIFWAGMWTSRLHTHTFTHKTT